MATDGSGTKVWEVSYLPFGGVHAATGSPSDLRFPGQWYQSESGLHQNWMRDYDPTTGRYIVADPLRLVDGPSVYNYVRQNPGRWVDPRGEDSVGQFAAGVVIFGYTYYQMREANWKLSDKYFHCKANCLAASLGANCTATGISDAREFLDQNVKGDTPAQSAADQFANRTGRFGGQFGEFGTCRTVCAQFRPNNLPPQY